MRFKPIHGILLVPVFVVGVFLLSGGFGMTKHQRVSPDAESRVTIDISDLQPGQVRFYRFLNEGNQEVKFFVGRDQHGTLQVAFDASESHARVGRGFRHEGDWLVDNKCDTASRLEEVNQGGGGCRPVPLEHRVQGERVVLLEDDILKGWRLFN
ncbi:MAG: Fe-S-containing protein [Thermoanaerobaculia bacterium]